MPQAHASLPALVDLTSVISSFAVLQHSYINEAVAAGADTGFLRLRHQPALTAFRPCLVGRRGAPRRTS
jgi:hypothetical protein